jgi:hypothetical protein
MAPSDNMAPRRDGRFDSGGKTFVRGSAVAHSDAWVRFLDVATSPIELTELTPS